MKQWESQKVVIIGGALGPVPPNWVVWFPLCCLGTSELALIQSPGPTLFPWGAMSLSKGEACDFKLSLLESTVNTQWEETSICLCWGPFPFFSLYQYVDMSHIDILYISFPSMWRARRVRRSAAFLAPSTIPFVDQKMERCISGLRLLLLSIA